MSKLIIYNQSPYFYHISMSIYKIFNDYMSNDQLLLINCTDHNFCSSDLYLLFMPLLNMNQMNDIKYIIYNFEQFTTTKIWSESYIYFLKNALYVIDYSILNICKLNEMGINAFFLPYVSTGLNKYDNSLNMSIKINEQKNSNITKDIDILFIGTLNTKRKEWLNKIETSKYNVKILTNSYYNESLEYFARSKILLNVHYYHGKSILEVARIIPALENNCIILTEKSDDEYYNYMYKNVIKKIKVRRKLYSISDRKSVV